MKRISQISLLAIAPVAITFATTTAASAAILWYGGDPDGAGSTQSSQHGDFFSFRPSQRVYDDFTVPLTDGSWNINTVWANIALEDTQVSKVFWSISQILVVENSYSFPQRQVIAEGLSSATLTPTNFSISGVEYGVYRLATSGLNINLNPGTYWLTVAPYYIKPDLGNSTPYYYLPFSGLATTTGTNSSGVPINNGNAYSVGYGGIPNSLGEADYSLGIEGAVVSAEVPEPASVLGWLTFSLFGAGVLKKRQQLDK